MDKESGAQHAVGISFRIPVNAGVCDDCGGRIVKRAVDFCRGAHIFEPPECEKCKAPYFGVRNAIEVGRELFYRTHGGPSS